MKKTIILCVFVLILSFSTSFGFAQEAEYIEIGFNAKTTTYVDKQTKGYKFSEDKVFELCLNYGKAFSDSNFEIAIYSKDELQKQFTDNYIYGTAINAALNLNYGLVQIQYFKYNDEPKSLVGWDNLFFVTMQNNKILCIKVIE